MILEAQTAGDREVLCPDFAAVPRKNEKVLLNSSVITPDPGGHRPQRPCAQGRTLLLILSYSWRCWAAEIDLIMKRASTVRGVYAACVIEQLVCHTEKATEARYRQEQLRQQQWHKQNHHWQQPNHAATKQPTNKTEPIHLSTINVSRENKQSSEAHT